MLSQAINQQSSSQSTILLPNESSQGSGSNWTRQLEQMQNVGISDVPLCIQEWRCAMMQAAALISYSLTTNNLFIKVCYKL